MKHLWKTVITSGVEYVDWCANCGTVCKKSPHDPTSRNIYFVIGTKESGVVQPRCRKVDRPEIPRAPRGPACPTLKQSLLP